MYKNHKPNHKSGFHHKLYRWHARHGRHHLPWRRTKDPYAIYISELMLQQTQVATVEQRYYQPFLQRFPTLQSVANAEQEEVLKQWQGLGYYSRARNLHQAARITAPYLPDTYEALVRLPGIGRNTACAILALGFHLPYPVMEANVKRVLCRIFALTSPTDKQLWQAAQSLLDPANPFDYNQAMMDLGALVCTPKTPDCATCPAADICEGKHTPEHYPQKKQNKNIPVRQRNIIIVNDAAGRYYLTPRTTRFLCGMYQFVELNIDDDTFDVADERLRVKDARYLGSITHTYSHFRLSAGVYQLTLSKSHQGNTWYHAEDIAKLPLSQADLKAWALIS